jgi:hypothetical protein
MTLNMRLLKAGQRMRYFSPSRIHICIDRGSESPVCKKDKEKIFDGGLPFLMHAETHLRQHSNLHRCAKLQLTRLGLNVRGVIGCSIALGAQILLAEIKPLRQSLY